MKKLLLIALLLLSVTLVKSQIAFINITDHNTGSGTNNLFNRYVSVGQTCYIDWEVWHPALLSTDPCGTETVSRLILRRMADTDPTSLIASAPIIVNGTCNGKAGNNDRYRANLAAAITVAGRYSVEIQADVLPLAGTAFDNSNTRTTWNYMCPPVYYISGTSGPTGNYYTPPGSCSFSGKSDPVGGGTTIDQLPEINPALNYFTVGESGAYRQMVIFNGVFYDMLDGKFQPGNIRVPTSMNGIIPFSSFGLCAAGTVPSFSMGAEINTFKRTDCSADVTGATMFYRVYKNGTTPPAYSSFAVPFFDNCPGPSGPAGNTFGGGGSCSNINNMLDQRWKTATGVVNILPTTLTTADAGTWNIEFYLQSTVRNCAGTLQTLTGTVNLTTFSVVDPGTPEGSFCTITPVFFKRFTAAIAMSGIDLQWEVEEAGERFTYVPEVSADGYRFQPMTTLASTSGTYQFTDASFQISGQPVAFYRIKAVDSKNNIRYSGILKVNRKGGKETTIQVMPRGAAADVRIQHLPRGRYSLCLYTADGRMEQQITLQQSQTAVLTTMIPLEVTSQTTVYIVVLKDAAGTIVASQKFVR